MFAILAAVVLAHQGIKSKWLGATLVCVVVVVFSFWTYERNSVWSDEVTFWMDIVAKSPQKARPRNNLGVKLKERGRIEEAIVHLREALRLKPDYAQAHNNLGNALSDQGEFDAAINHLSEAVRLLPYSEQLHYNLGNAYKSKGRLDEAIEQYEKALSIQPDFTDAMNNLALAHVGKGEYDKALLLYRRIMGLQPSSYVAYYNTACLYAKQNEVEQAVDWLKQAVKRGFIDWDFLRTDGDLENIRHTAYFKRLTERRENIQSN
jgi:tetratricopeptide (TPR) repeat protein